MESPTDSTTCSDFGDNGESKMARM
jgi:hypothetical protein